MTHPYRGDRGLCTVLLPIGGPAPQHTCDATEANPIHAAECGACKHPAHWRECQAPVVGLLGSTYRCECRRRGPQREYRCECGHFEAEHTVEGGCAGCDAGGQPIERILHAYVADPAWPEEVEA